MCAAARNRYRNWVTGCAALALAILAAYANYFGNSFHFDDAHTIVNNAAIRDLQNIPAFFRDASTFSSLPSNQSYRPLVSTLLAVDYRLGGLQPFWFHLSIFALFIALALLLAFVIYRLLNDALNYAANSWIALVAAGLYALHPANADTVNYVIASSEVVSTLGVVASFAMYFAFPNLRPFYLYVLPAALGILAKPPAAIFVLLFVTYRLLFGRRDARPTETRLQRTAQITVPFVVCGAVLLFVQHMTPRNWIAGAANARNYLITQPYVALLYEKTFFWPDDFSADYDLNPFTTTNDPRFWLGFAFITLFIAAATIAAVIKKTRVIGFGLLWFLTALLPTSLFPLAEVMNDHRTFLRYIGFVIAIAGVASLLVAQRATRSLPAKIAATGTMLLILCASGYATFQRNKVWKTEESLWRDVATKSPRNPRGLMNYGNTLMAKGDFAGALDHFHRALAFAPRYSVLLINRAIAEEATKQSQTAEQHICATYNKLGRYEEAAAACEQALRYKPDWQLARNNLQYAREMAKKR
jgi:tetratricopeptide (TPR) repeat protein